MGNYLNNTGVAFLYAEEMLREFFVDKTPILDDLIPRIANRSLMYTPKDKELPEFNFKTRGNKYVCITRPRRFGKSVMALMIAAYLGKGIDTGNLFDRLEVHTRSWYKQHLNQHNVFYIRMDDVPESCSSYSEYITLIRDTIVDDLKSAFPDISLNDDRPVWNLMTYIASNSKEEIKFIFVLDEWDYIFSKSYCTDEDKRNYLEFLKDLLKDRSYVELVYMTGILPIAKYSSGSELNMFSEYTMSSTKSFCGYFGFTEEEVDELFDRYQRITYDPQITREELRNWYDGYGTAKGFKVYNPCSVVSALDSNELRSYWKMTGPREEIFSYIKHNTGDVREDLARMVAGIPVPACIDEYTATSMNLTTKDEIYSAMVVYGFLSYENGYLRIPNYELMNEFKKMMKEEPSLGYIHQLAVKSSEILAATLRGDTAVVAEVMEFAHDTEIPLLNYNNESDLAALVNLVYLSARDYYRVEREDRSGKGYVDIIFYPEKDLSADGIILELKVNRTANYAIKQIKEKQYILRFQGKLGQESKYTGRILAVGIAYNKKKKIHTCKIEILRDRIRTDV